MNKEFRPSPDQLRLFSQLAWMVREHMHDYLEAAAWFDGEFSLDAIDARAEADVLPMERELRAERERAGWVYHKRQDRSGYMARLLRATENLIEVDDSALPKADRLEHSRRVVFVTVLMTDPDFQKEVPVLAEALRMDRPHWPSAKALTVGGEEIELDRWWARDIVFGPDFEAYRSFEPLVARALDAVHRVHAAKEPGAAIVTQATEPASQLPVVAPTFDAAALNAVDRGVLLALELARRESPPQALNGGEIKSACAKHGFVTFRDADHARRTVYSLRDRQWPIPNALNGTGYRLERALAELCPDLARVLEEPLQRGTN